MQSFRTILLALGALAFAVFALLQLNDTTQYSNQDAWSWIVLYGVGAILSAALIWIPLPGTLTTSWAGFCWGALVFRLQDDVGNFQLSRLNPASYWNESGTEMTSRTAKTVVSPKRYRKTLKHDQKKTPIHDRDTPTMTNDSDS